MDSQIDTAQQRAEEFVECVLSFIEKTSGRKIQFKTIVDMSTGTQSNPTERLVAAITNRDKQARREALEEAAKVCREFSKPYDIDWWRETPKTEVYKTACLEMIALLDRLREGW